MTIFECVPHLFPPVAWFLSLPRQSTIVIDLNRRWNKRDKSTHRYRVADVNGPIELTVPVTKPDSYSTAHLSDIKLSRHGNWWHVHRVTLESGYGRTPFFEHYFPKMERFFSDTTTETYPFLWEYLIDTLNMATSLLDLDTSFTTLKTLPSGNMLELPEIQHSLIDPYWQIRCDRFNFLQNLSILDLLFNLGPEAALYIRAHRT